MKKRYLTLIIILSIIIVGYVVTTKASDVVPVYLLNPAVVVNTGNITYNVTNVTNNYGGSSYNKSYEYQLNSTLNNWNYLFNFPSACSVGNAITQLLGTPVCSPFMTNTFNATYEAKPSNIFNTTYNSFIGNCSTSQFVQNITSAGIQCTLPTVASTFNSTYNSFISNCSAGQVVMNITSSGPQCVVASSSTFNSTYDLFVRNNVSNQAENSYFINNSTERNLFTATFNSSYMTNIFNATYNTYVTNNVSNQSQFCYWVNNATERNLFLSTFNSTYDALRIFNASYEYWTNASLTQTFNATYEAKPSNTFNSTYDAKPSSTFNSSYDAQLNHNTTAEIQAAVNNTGVYNFSTVYINNTLCLRNGCLSNITWNGTNTIFNG